MEKAALSLDQPMARIAHIEKLGKKNAIAFYEWGTNPQYFGIARLKKTIFGWHFTGGSTSAEPKEHKFGWSLPNHRVRGWRKVLVLFIGARRGAGYRYPCAFTDGRDFGAVSQRIRKKSFPNASINRA
ncbi:hypothetical protein [Paenibacillus glycanilyticus]|uniref:hypothetical protein n=1 Tax=Paenibacillus glycanilyticus TaxID=126569 RepID=UPI003EB91DB7